TLGVLTDITELKKAREQNLLLETSKALSRTLKLDQVLKIGTKKMAKALKADRCGVAFSDQNMQSVTVKHIYLEDGSPSPALLGSPLSFRDCYEAKESVRTKGYYQISNTRTDPIPKPLRNYFLRTGVKSCLIIPMFIGKKLLGLFNIGSVKELRNFTKEEIRLAQTIANQVAVAVENSLLLEDIKGKHDQIVKQTKVLERQYQEQRILMKISRALSQTLDLDRILEIATKEAAQALQVDRCAVALAFPEEDYAEIRSIYVKVGKSAAHLLGYKLYEHHFPQAKEMFEKRKLINIPNISHLADKSFAKKYFIKEEIKSALFAPMVHGKKLVGFFVLSTMKDFKTFTREETKLAQTIADQ
ncbi:MAG: GAF domain-containing protein, partial [candidate division Zixibacteria bacterium]|nr:GAF domain-containing protein [candidate division Zixibacteria bacterium]